MRFIWHPIYAQPLNTVQDTDPKISLSFNKVSKLVTLSSFTGLLNHRSKDTSHGTENLQTKNKNYKIKQENGLNKVLTDC